MMLGGMVQFQLDDKDYVLKGVGGWGLGVNTKMNMFWHERSAFQRSAFGRSTAGNDVVATVIISLFFFSPFFSGFFSCRNLFS